MAVEDAVDPGEERAVVLEHADARGKAADVRAGCDVDVVVHLEIANPKLADEYFARLQQMSQAPLTQSRVACSVRTMNSYSPVSGASTLPIASARTFSVIPWKS